MQQIILRAMEPADIDAIYRWENDPSTWTVSAAHQPFSRQALQRFIDECSSSDIYTSRQQRLMADSDGGTAVGCVDLYDFDPFHRRAAIGIIVDSNQRHKGYGTAMLGAIEDFASRHLDLHQLHCIVAANNKHSLTLFEKAGYTACGTIKEWILDGRQWIDAQIFQKILER